MTSTEQGFMGKLKDWLLEGCGNGQPCVWYLFGGAYGILALATLVQLVRIQLRLHEYGWTMQKTFHVFNLCVCVSRCLALCLWNVVSPAGKTEDGTWAILLFDLPSLLFFTTYTLLILFWAEVVHAAKAPTAVRVPRVAYGSLNVGAYALSIIFWVLCAVEGTRDVGKLLDSVLQIVLNLIATVAFVFYGNRLLLMLRVAPGSSGSVLRNKKTVEVTLVTVLASLCFVGKAVLAIVSIASTKGLDYSGGYLYDSLFYGCTEILVIAASLGILSTMPPRRRTTEQYESLVDSSIQSA